MLKVGGAAYYVSDHSFSHAGGMVVMGRGFPVRISRVVGFEVLINVQYFSQGTYETEFWTLAHYLSECQACALRGVRCRVTMVYLCEEHAHPAECCRIAEEPNPHKEGWVPRRVSP